MSGLPGATDQGLPHRIAVLCDLRDAQGRVLLIHRNKNPNKGLYSPIGGKLDEHTGESPAMAARREIAEEAGIDVGLDRLRLVGIVSECAYQGDTHWLMFWYRVQGSVEVVEHTIREGRLEWHELAELSNELEGDADAAPGRLPLPETDRKVIWPLVLGSERGVFSVHIDCRSAAPGTDDGFTWAIEECSVDE